MCNDPEPSEPAATSLCDDKQPDGGLLRPDGSHILVDKYGPQTAEKVLTAVLQAAR